MTEARLVRDRWAQFMREQGVAVETRVASPEEYRTLLHAELFRVSEDFQTSQDSDKLVDLYELLIALAADLGLSHEELEALRAQKAEERGGFEKMIVWMGNLAADDAEDTNVRCPSEGVDVPAIDAVAFTHPKQSKQSTVEIVQAIGRALRRDPDGSGVATILVPILLPDGADDDADSIGDTADTADTDGTGSDQ